MQGSCRCQARQAITRHLAVKKIPRPLIQILFFTGCNIIPPFLFDMQISFLYTFSRHKNYYNISSGRAGGFQQEYNFTSEVRSGESNPQD
jgi:hypothetical protein